MESAATNAGSGPADSPHVVRVPKPGHFIPAPGGPERPAYPPLTHSQRALWFLDRLYAGTPLYNVPFAVRLTGPLDTDALLRALTRIAARHEILRTVFPVRDDEPYQSVKARPDVPLARADLSHPAPAPAPAPAEREAEGLRVIRGWAEEPFDLGSGPLFRAGLVRLAEDDHIFGIFLHHIVCDGRSIHILFDELAAGYSGEPLPALATQFADYAVQQQSAATRTDRLAWWKDHLAGAPTKLALPTDRPRSTIRRWAGATHWVRLPAELVTGAVALARRERVTPFMVMAATYAVLLGKLTGAEDLLLGTPVAGRSRAEHEPLIGFFVNTLPIRIRLGGHPTFAELLRRVRAATLASVAHADTPFDALVDSLRTDRDPGITQLVQTVLTFESAPLAEPRLAGLSARLLPLMPDAAKFDLDVMIVRAPDDSGDFDLSITYSTALFDPDTIARHARRFEALLTAGVADPQARLHGLPTLTQDEQREADELWNRPASPDPEAPPVLVHEWVTRQARSRPHAPAARSAGRTASYAELDARSEALAAHLAQAGLGPGDVVGVLLPRGLDLITAILGILKSGAAYLPLDDTHPVDRLARVLRAVGSRLVVTGAPTRTGDRLAEVDRVRLLPMDSLDLDLDTWPPGHRGRRRVRPDDLAYVIFTSGSTGEPKGVAVPHGALANHAHAIRDRFGLGPGDRVLQFSGITFDVAAEELFPTWAAGGCAVLCPVPVPAPAQLTGVLEAESVTVANLPASYWQQWQHALAGAPDAVPPALRLLVVGSETVDPVALARWRELTGIRTINAYGLTETTITAATYDVGPSFGDRQVPVGTPIAGVRAYVLDAGLNQTPPGVTGELFIGGAGLARGYLGHPGLTAARFVADPFAGRPGARMHRAGDLARRGRDGVIQLLGRADEQLKVRGYRIEPGEVEAAMCAHPDVVQAVAVADNGPDGVSRLIGYVVPRGGGHPPDLRAYLMTRLPAYLVPSILLWLPELPLSSSGKVDRAALPTPPRAAAASPGVPPRTDMERRISEIWQQVLHLAQVGMDDNFFDLGGNSFGLAAVHGEIRERLGHRVPLVTLYEFPTVSLLAAHLAGEPGEPGEPGDGPQAG